jgi:type 1 glutamine amidotransferase
MSIKPKLKLLTFSTVLIIILIAIPHFNYSQENSNSKNILYVYGGWEGHQPLECKDLFVPWLKEQGYNVIVSDNLDSYTDSTLMNSIDLVIQSFSMPQITQEQDKGLLSAVNNGVAIAGWHGGFGDSFRNNTVFQFMFGGQWVAHPGGNVKYAVNIINSTDPITKCVQTFLWILNNISCILILPTKFLQQQYLK